MLQFFLVFLIFILSFVQVNELSFRDQQLMYDRVFVAYQEKSEDVYSKLKKVGIQRDDFEVFIRGFKFEEDLEVWAKNRDEHEYRLVTTYKFCQNIGDLGPKRKEGDKQIPEGVYSLSNFNPNSDFFLSLQVDYPNTSDRILSDPRYPGGLIFIHGGCETIGCIPITDNFIKELYIICVEAKNNGQKDIPIHLFPARLTDENFTLLKNQCNDQVVVDFWNQLKIGFQLFEDNKIIPRTIINSKGDYLFFE